MSEHLSRFGFLFVGFLLVGALAVGIYALRFWSEHGEADPRRHARPTGSTGLESCREQIKPILAKPSQSDARCSSC